MRLLLLTFTAGLCACACKCERNVVAAHSHPPELPDFARGVAVTVPMGDPRQGGELVFSDPTVWKFGKDNAGKGFLELAYDRKAYKSAYNPKHRSPVHIAVFKQFPVTDFAFDVEVMSTTEVYGHQDACLFFGIQDPQHFYYVHLAPTPDANAHNVFIVNDAPRKNLLEPQKKGVVWKKDTWHKLRLVRQGTTGKTEVFFDDLKTPVLAVEDRTFQKGLVGFGSFDDTARFRNAAIYTKTLTLDKPADFFKPLGK